MPISRLQAIIVVFHDFPSEIGSNRQATDLALTYFKAANPNPEFTNLIKKLPPDRGYDVFSLNLTGGSIDEFPRKAVGAVVEDYSECSFFAQGARRKDPYYIDTLIFIVFEPRAGEEKRRTMITDDTPIIPVWQ